MTYIVVQSNISAIQAWITFVGLGVLICLEGYGSALHAAIARQIPFDRFRNEECGWMFWIAWLTSCFLFSLLGSLFVWDMYTVSYQSDAAPLIFGALLFYIIAMRGWIWVTYTMRWSSIVTYVMCVFAVISALLVLGLAFLSINDHPWHHYFCIVLLLPPIAVIYSVYTWGPKGTGASYSSSSVVTSSTTTTSTHFLGSSVQQKQPQPPPSQSEMYENRRDAVIPLTNISSGPNSMMTSRGQQQQQQAQSYDLSRQLGSGQDLFPV